MPPEKSKWIPELELLRGLAIIGVLVIHTTGYFTQVQGDISLTMVMAFVDNISSFAVPMFMLLSGFLLTFHRNDNERYLVFLYKRLRFVLPSYLIISVLYELFYSWWNKVQLPSWQSFLGHLWYGSSSYQLYFIPIIVWSYVLYHITIWLYRRVNPYGFLFFSLGAQFIWIYRQLFIHHFAKYWPIVGGHVVSLILQSMSFLQVYFFFVLGIHLALHYDEIRDRLLKTPVKIWIVLAIASTLIVTLDQLHGMQMYHGCYNISERYMVPVRLFTYVSNVTVSVWLYYLVVQFNRGSVFYRLLERIAALSFPIYLLHVFFATMALRYFPKEFVTFDRWVFYPLFFCSIALISYGVSRLISFFPFHWYIIGKVSKSAWNERSYSSGI